MNPTQPDFWTARFAPSEQPVLTAARDRRRRRDQERAGEPHRHPRLQEADGVTDINLKFAENQKLPAIDLTARYGLAGVAGTALSQATRRFPSGIRSFGDALRDVFGNDFKTWSFVGQRLVSARHEPGRRGVRAGEAAAAAGAHHAGEPRDAGDHGGARGGPAGEHQPEARGSDAQSARPGAAASRRREQALHGRASRPPSSCSRPSAICRAPSRAS